ncbi:hypothetical protein Scep_024401 [Stephania cephalantha]|uniref:Uncharacterized protein n=1 Tax=Stephania cephalantha TaxID=152367 RepID=A0AAP0EWH2_9MAGN
MFDEGQVFVMGSSREMFGWGFSSSMVPFIRPSGSFVGSTRRNAYVRISGGDSETGVKFLSLYVSYGGKQHVPLSLFKSHAQIAMEVILKSSVDRTAVQSSCDELDGENKTKRRALTKEAPLVMLHTCDKINDRLMLHGIGFSLDIPEWVANDFYMSTDASMANESVGAHASEYQSHSRHRHIQCEGLEMIGGK